MALMLYRAVPFFFFLFLGVFGQASLRAAEVDWFITNAVDADGRPIRTDDSTFSCSDRIYTMVFVSDLNETTHTLIVDWIDPSGRQREHTVHKFRYLGGRQWMWAWLTLHPPRGTIALRIFNPSVGMREFVGTWTVRVIIDDLILGRDNFEVLC